MATERHTTLTEDTSSKGSRAATTAPPASKVVIQMPRLAFWALAIAIIAPWPWLIVAVRDASENLPEKSSQPASARPGRTVRCNPGPWGELEYTRILIEPPEEFIPAKFDTSKEIRWFFKGYTREAVQQLWQSAGLTSLGDHVIANGRDADGVYLRPSKEFILGMSAEARARIYTTLAEWPENMAQKEPYRFRADAADEWFADSGLSDQTMALVKRLLYQRGTSLCFSDEDTLSPMLSSPAEQKKLRKTLARKSTLLLKLRVSPESDIDALSQYWGKGNRSKDVKPLLQSLSLHHQGVKLDVAHLLPRNARMLLYTYPFPNSTPGAAAPDCHWTSLNFLNLETENRFLDPDVVRKTLETDYYPVPGERTFGDLLLFFRPDGTHAHSCVYIADDIVFTKNGSWFAMPWILMTLSDVQAFYPSEPPMDIVTFRLKRG